MRASQDWQNRESAQPDAEPGLEFDRDGRKVLVKGSSGKALRFAGVMAGATVFLALVIGALMPRPIEQRASLAPPSRLNLATPARSTPKSAHNTLTYRAGSDGHFYVDAFVNGAPVRFMVDTGATVVALSPDDARAVGLADGDLRFSETMSTANGQAHAARATLRSVRLDQLEIADVPAVVMEQSMPVSLLGLSFLGRLDGYSISDGVLTIEW